MLTTIIKLAWSISIAVAYVPRNNRIMILNEMTSTLKFHFAFVLFISTLKK